LGEEFEVGPDFLREQKLNTPDRDGSTRPQAPRRPAPPTPFQLARNADTSPMAPLDNVLPTRPLPELVQCPSPARPRAGSLPQRRGGSPSSCTPPRLPQRKNSFIQPTKPVSPLSQCSQRSGSVGRTSLDGFTERKPNEQVRSATLPLNRSKTNVRTTTVHMRSVESPKCNCICCIDHTQQTQALKDEMETLQQQHERLQHQHRILQQQMEQKQQMHEDTLRGHEQIKALEIEQIKQKYERQLTLQAGLLEKEFELVLQKSHSKR